MDTIYETDTFYITDRIMNLEIHGKGKYAGKYYLLGSAINLDSAIQFALAEFCG